jgi:hypothetical protein
MPPVGYFRSVAFVFVAMDDVRTLGPVDFHGGQLLWHFLRKKLTDGRSFRMATGAVLSIKCQILTGDTENGHQDTLSIRIPTTTNINIFNRFVYCEFIFA